MKVEKINENQVKFILSHADLVERDIKLTDLAYGSEKTQELLNEMMEKAMIECDFNLDNTPLMIEAVPISLDSIVIIVTKVTSPDMLASKLNISRQDLLRRRQPDHDANEDDIIIFSFASLDTAANACGRLYGRFSASNSLYKNNGRYFLMLQNNKEEDDLATGDIVALLSEYGQKHVSTVISRAYLEEHGEYLIKDGAIRVLCESLLV